MTTAVPIVPSEDILRLEFCPRCDYSLEGLPDAGRCPECGEGYDQAFVILRGKPAPSSEAGLFSRRGILWNGGAAAMLLAGMSFADRGSSLSDPYIVVAVAYSGLFTGISLAGWLLSQRSGDVLIWFNSSGIGLRLPIEPRSVMGRLGEWLECLPSPVILIPSLIGLRSFPILSFCMAGFGISVQLLGREAGRPKMSARAEGIRPALYGWREFREIRLKPLGKNQHRLSAMHSSWVARRAFFNVVIDASDSKAQELRTRISKLAGFIWVN